MMDHQALHDLIAENTEIACSVLAKVMGYPYQYAEAQRILEYLGWVYDVDRDAWYRPVGFV